MHAPARRVSPLVFASPHSGRDYTGRALARASLPLGVLRQSEDAYVDELLARAPDLGVPVIKALFPRVFVDVNRSEDELDPDMFDPPPAGLAQVSARAAAGLGVIPRVAADGRALYAGRLALSEAHERLAHCYRPYHTALRSELEAARQVCGEAVLIDWHSMPAASARGADIVLGDRYGASCSRALTARAETQFRALGFTVMRNRPYAGGYTTEHYGRPASGVQALQIEINRGLYLDERQVRPSARMPALTKALTQWIEAMIEDSTGVLRAAE
ncbi:N-formylglutamate amidohydrolase [Alkalicaulis satelles]|uniref:N-formylglutamate amidohydrolase n=1 Tax=Alkalicaulis satelles TaxID=2609175 RepID=UPI001E647700|nr:N-formylglutamate amidohydrolase [Alkalicaulis satelles]